MPQNQMKIALSIAGSDSSAGAGIQADLKTFSAVGVYGATVITAVTAQNTLGVTAVHVLPASMVTAQMEAVFADLAVGAVKTGMLGDSEVVAAVAEGLEKLAPDVPIIVDPVMVSTTGHRLLDPDGEKLIVSKLFPLAALITPNLFEAATLLGEEVAKTATDIRGQAERLAKRGARAVLVKGGHGTAENAADHFFDGTTHRTFASARIATKNTHGTGCTLGSAIAAYALLGLPTPDAIASAKGYLQKALLAGAEKKIGHGHGPLWHF